MSLTTKTLEHIVLAYDLPTGPAVDRGKVAEVAQKIAQAEAPHAGVAAQPVPGGFSSDGLSVNNSAKY